MTIPVSVSDSGARFGNDIVVGSHPLSASELFTDQAIASLLDQHPRELIFALTMGSEPTRLHENVFTEHAGVTGAEMLACVAKGRFWLNIKGVERHGDYGATSDGLYASLRREFSGFSPSGLKSTLLVSSPGAIVYYHVDGPPSVLWQMRGKKQIWVYPALDERFVARHRLEEIMAGAAQEYLPYNPSFDSAARAVTLAPGAFCAWPQNAPHRVRNGPMLNVSLSTEHFTKESRRRTRVYVANRFLHKASGIADWGQREHGLWAWLKVGVHRAARWLGFDRPTMKRPQKTMRMDPMARRGLSLL